MGRRGLTRTNDEGRGKTLADEPSIALRLLGILEEAWQNGFTVQCDFARSNAELVAMAASLQLITTRINSQVFGRAWQITSKGLRWLNEHKETRANENGDD